jgi:hypothetical protein
MTRLSTLKGSLSTPINIKIIVHKIYIVLTVAKMSILNSQRC